MAFLHGPEIIEVTSSARPIRTANTSIIGIVGTAPAADASAFPYDTPVLIAASQVDAAKLASSSGDRGTLPVALQQILQEAGALVVVVRVEEGVDADATRTAVIGGVDGTDGSYSGVQALLGAESVTGYRPRILIAPGFTHDRPEGNANPVVTALDAAATKLRGIVIADGPNTTDAAAFAYADDWSSTRNVYVVDPKVTTYDNTAETPATATVYGSATAAGILARTDNELGFWYSPSNKAARSITGTARPIDFAIGESTSRANLLNENQVATFIRHEGFRLWGNLTTSSEPMWSFLSIVRINYAIQDAIQRAHMAVTDLPMSKTLVGEIVENVNEYLRVLKTRGAILGGEAFANPDLNTNDVLASGQLYVDYEFTPPPPLQRPTFRSKIVDTYLSELVA